MDELACQHRFLSRRAHLCFWRGRRRWVGEVTEGATTTTATPCGPEQAQRRAVAPTECDGHRRSTLDARSTAAGAAVQQQRRARACERRGALLARAVPPTINRRERRSGWQTRRIGGVASTDTGCRVEARPTHRKAPRAVQGGGPRTEGPRAAGRARDEGWEEASQRGRGCEEADGAAGGRGCAPKGAVCVCGGGKEVGGAPHATDARARNE